MQSINQNPMPKLEVLPHAVEKAFEYAERAWKFGRSILRNTNVPNHMSNHYHPEHFGAAAMLDEHLDAQPELPFGDSVDLRKQPSAGWDESGNYISFVPGREA